MSRLLPIPLLTRRLGAALLLAALGLSGCGQKGPLYLPDEEPAAAPTANETSQTTADPN